jgi:protocatechuate 3,4-dioxygenase beta subunit
MKTFAFLLALGACGLVPVHAHAVTASENPTELPRDETSNPDEAQTAKESVQAVAGNVLDPSGAGVPGAQVTLTDTNGGVFATTTDNSGAFGWRKCRRAAMSSS